MRAIELTGEVEGILRAAGLAEPREEALHLVLALSAISRTALYARNPEVSPEVAQHVMNGARRRASGEPLAYIQGYVEFMGLMLGVGPGVLIPRPETEIILTEFLKALPSLLRPEDASRAGRQGASGALAQSAQSSAAGGEPRAADVLAGGDQSASEALADVALRETKTSGAAEDIARGDDRTCDAKDFPAAIEAIGSLKGIALRALDLCCGSGCITIALASALPDARVTGVDISREALAFARASAARNLIGNAVFLEGDLYAPVAGQRFDVITANPPYIVADVVDTLEVARHEPRLALDGGPDGLDYYRRIIAGSRDFLSPGGVLFLELGDEQCADVVSMARGAGLELVRVIADYSGVERAVVLKNS